MIISHGYLYCAILGRQGHHRIAVIYITTTARSIISRSPPSRSSISRLLPTTRSIILHLFLPVIVLEMVMVLDVIVLEMVMVVDGVSTSSQHGNFLSSDKLQEISCQDY